MYAFVVKVEDLTLPSLINLPPNPRQLVILALEKALALPACTSRPIQLSDHAAITISKCVASPPQVPSANACNWNFLSQAKENKEDSDATSRPALLVVAASDADADSSASLGRSMTDVWAMLQSNGKMSEV